MYDRKLVVGSPILKVRRIEIRFESVLIKISDLSFCAGEMVGIVGPNGCGKSSLLRALSRSLQPHVFEIDLVGGFVPRTMHQEQGARVFADLTVNENLRIAHGQSRVGGEGPSVALHPRLQGLGTARAGLLSGGERQLLASSMAAASRSDVLLIDEPLAGVEKELTPVVLENLKRIAMDHLSAVVVVDHHIDLLTKFSDHIYAFQGTELSGHTTVYFEEAKTE